MSGDSGVSKDWQTSQAQASTSGSLDIPRRNAAAAACTYRANSVPLVPLSTNQAAGHLSTKKHAEQQLSYTDRSLAVVRASSPDFIRKDMHDCLQLLVMQTTTPVRVKLQLQLFLCGMSRRPLVEA